MANGIIIIDKPADWTSMDVCSKLRRLLDERRIGHAGTLDPMATGVLPVFVGRATRAVEFAAVRRQDLRGRTEAGAGDGHPGLHRPGAGGADLSPVTGRRWRRCWTAFRGDIFQVPPMYSALKVNGKKLYQLARKGKTVERKPRPITIFGLDILRQDAPDHYTIQVTCSKGTYIRTLCHDIGQKLGCGGVMDALRRTEAAGFTLEQAVTLEQVVQAAEAGQAQGLLMPVDTYFARYPALTIQGKAERLCRHGNGFPWEGENGRYRVYGSDGSFLMLGEIMDGRDEDRQKLFRSGITRIKRC